ncbi:hypothetical protein [Pseudophaeobacter leonis]|uniref:hypothetical protein n=1 Tax=Pseudophaeobacter leonis TaxID=1144477 RepID=UPI0009F3B482|nr:hypothetical protein [Pseudophaeobacter leonis]
MNQPRSLEHLFFYMPILARSLESRWERDFAADMAKRARWKNWHPSHKQNEIMQRMVAEMFAPSDASNSTLDLIDTGDRHDAA